jgi:hypothetical protein
MASRASTLSKRTPIYARLDGAKAGILNPADFDAELNELEKDAGPP